MRKLGKMAFGLVALLGSGGCKQGLGDRCQISSDCESGLVCSTGQKMVCTDTATAAVADAATGVGLDARVIIDAGFIPDAAPPDARPLDAPTMPADASEPVADAAQAPADAAQKPRR